MAETRRYKYRLQWSGREDRPSLRAAVEHLRTFHLFKDAEAKIIDQEEYDRLVAKKEIAEPKSYWGIEEGEVGLIALDYYSNYTKTWELISTALGDFEAGWKACEKHTT